MIKRYLWRAIFGYFALSWIVLTAILLLQQGSRYSDLVFNVAVPTNIVLELGAALFPSIVAFTAPMALLVGIVVAFGQLQGDSELVAMRAAGIGTGTLLQPVLWLGGALVAATIFINLAVVPEAAARLRQVSIRAAIAKLESPIEPGTFNTEIPNYVVYVRDGDNARGLWERVFLFSAEKSGAVRLITARAGRIDSARERSELVLSEAVVTSLPAAETLSNKKTQVTVEKVASLRVALETGRQQLLTRLQNFERVPDEMGLVELLVYAAGKTGKERIDALVLWYRRIFLAAAPLVFAWLGATLGLRFGRGGRGSGTLLALAALVAYYLLSLLGEQMARAGQLPIVIGSGLASFAAIGLGTWFLRQLITGARQSKSRLGWNLENFQQVIFGRAGGSFTWQNFFGQGRIAGLLERDLTRGLIVSFGFAAGSLVALFLVFTAFELWRYAAVTRGGIGLLGTHLLFLAPTAVLQIVPVAIMIAVLAVYSVKSRKSEVAAWQAAGTSKFKLLIPALMLAIGCGVVGWYLAETVLPQTNRRQEALRRQLRGNVTAGSQTGRYWVATPDKLYAFSVQPEQLTADTVETASDVWVYEFDPNTTHLKSFLRAAEAVWQNEELTLTGLDKRVEWKQTVQIEETNDSSVIQENSNPFAQIITRPSFLSGEQITEQLQGVQSKGEERRLEVALARKTAFLALPLIMVLFTAPLVLQTNSRRASAARAITVTVAVWLIFTAIAALFEQFGNNGTLPPLIAIWSPLVIFASFGGYLLTRQE